MTGYLTVGLILGGGLYFALLCWTRARDEGRVHRPLYTGELYLRALREFALAAQAAERAARRFSHAFGAFQVNARRAFDRQRTP